MILPFRNKGLVVLAGGLGSGKTELAVNLAFVMSDIEGKTVSIVDLDIIKPYFKARDLGRDRRSPSVRIIAPPQAFSNADLPVIPPEARAAISTAAVRSVSPDKADIKTGSVIIDIGGDEAGARVLGGFRDEISAGNYDFFFVMNISRPFLRDAESVVPVIREIERQSGLKVTGLVNNTHMMQFTDSALIENGREQAEKVSEMTGIPFAFTCISDSSDYSPLRSEDAVFRMNLYFSGRI